MVIRVKVGLIGVFQGLSGKSQLPLELEEPAAVRDVVRKIAESSPPQLNRALIDPELNDPRPNALILVNGKEVGVLDGLETEVVDGDDIVLISVAHGG